MALAFASGLPLLRYLLADLCAEVASIRHVLACESFDLSFGSVAGVCAPRAAAATFLVRHYMRAFYRILNILIVRSIGKDRDLEQRWHRSIFESKGVC